MDLRQRRPQRLRRLGRLGGRLARKVSHPRQHHPQNGELGLFQPLPNGQSEEALVKGGGRSVDGAVRPICGAKPRLEADKSEFSGAREVRVPVSAEVAEGVESGLDKGPVD